jgi:hypothetical protein
VQEKLENGETVSRFKLETLISLGFQILENVSKENTHSPTI